MKPLPLPKGTTLSMRYTYDNSAENRRNPQRPPRRVLWGQNSSDEMGDLWIQVVPRSAADLARLTREFRQKVFREDIAGYESVLRVTPDDVSLHDDVALLYLEVGRVDQAIAHFARSVRLAPDSAAAHSNLGTAFSAAGRIDEAIGEYRRALELKPDYVYALNNLGSMFAARGRFDEAVGQYRRAIEANPAHVEAHNNLGNVLAHLGHLDEASDHLRRALELRSTYPDAHYNLARVLVAQGRAQDAAVHYHTALRLRPDWPVVLAEFAWLLATSAEDGVRDPKQAISLAERAVALTPRPQPALLDVLAAAYAVGGRFDRAIATARSALALLAENDPAGRAPEIQQRLALYEQQRPYVESSLGSRVLGFPRRRSPRVIDARRRARGRDCGAPRRGRA